MALELKLAMLAFWFYARSGRNSDLYVSLSFLEVQLTAVLSIMVMLVMSKVMKKYCN